MSTRQSLAPSLEQFLAPGGSSKFAPQPGWYRSLNEYSEASIIQKHTSIIGSSNFKWMKATDSEAWSAKTAVAQDHTALLCQNLVTRRQNALDLDDVDGCCLFGRDLDSALHVAVRMNAVDAVRLLLDHGAHVDVLNAKRATPLIIVSQKGNCNITDELIKRGANPFAVNASGATAVLQAAHFGHDKLLKKLLHCGGPELVEIANCKKTTPLMRAAQEGHLRTLKILIDHGAQTNSFNEQQMTALMLAAQRGHSDACKLLIKHGADLNAVTDQGSSALMLASKRGHRKVVISLIAAGCELWQKDRHGRTARDIAQQLGRADLMRILHSSVQNSLMQDKDRQQRCRELLRTHRFLQGRDLSSFAQLLEVDTNLQSKSAEVASKSTQVLIRAMALPSVLVAVIALFLPHSRMWQARILMLANRALLNPDKAVADALDIIDEMFEDFGFLKACESAQIAPPDGFESWSGFKAAVMQRQFSLVQVARASCKSFDDIPSQLCPAELRRQAGYLELFAKTWFAIGGIQSCQLLKMPNSLLQHLVTAANLASEVRKQEVQDSSFHFESCVAMQLMLLVCACYVRLQTESTVKLHHFLHNDERPTA